ncbi:hypothetical protein SDRG_05597 [Saprolegnia diclina VS20]|uniref:Uncharacterized protein n=1 Tax=Saprolegnia diclina (strain VS20) TaxID=1156394 RepID=T0QPT9_SAPDV|nr:hypothetical protein SDRG_05597 [Saprolegnia diclina VS20]EQC36761.1 hypothetical protein SDRG_05597 [Saprolegnia diclina VS20]|eukprot:XP_008609542.1 hypothetical protein SDRG_05597 [Saprolegnia diclina VS20]
MFAVDLEFAADKIELCLDFDGAVLVDDDDVNDAPHDVPSGSNFGDDTLARAIERLKLLDASSLAALLHRMDQLETAVSASTRQLATQESETRHLRQLYHSAIQENERLAQQQAQPVVMAQPTSLQSSLQEVMEMDLKVHALAKEKDQLVSENQRVTSLCAQFQQEVMWKTLDLSDNQRSLQRLEWQLASEKTKVDDKTQEIADMRAKVAALEDQTATLLKHKKVLITEVKSLQKYSHVNVTALAQDAHEARMVQKSLAEKLASVQHERDALQASLQALPSPVHASLVAVDKATLP